MRWCVLEIRNSSESSIAIVKLRVRLTLEIWIMYSRLIAVARCITALAMVGMTCGCAQKEMQPRVFALLESYSEGIAFDPEGAAYASVLNGKAVYVMRRAGVPATWHEAIEPNGHKVLPDGTHLIAARGGVRHVDRSGALIGVLASQLATPNDLALDGDGGVYITVPAESVQEREANRSGVYYMDAHRNIRKVADDVCFPNGVVVRADGRTLLVNDSCNRRVYAFQIDAPGVLTGRRLFAEVANEKSVPDGMTLDQAGRLYMADYGSGVIVVFGQDGNVIHEYPTGLQHASNVAFGVQDSTELFVTGSTGEGAGSGRVMVLPLDVAGRNGSALPASIGGR